MYRHRPDQPVAWSEHRWISGSDELRFVISVGSLVSAQAGVPVGANTTNAATTASRTPTSPAAPPRSRFDERLIIVASRGTVGPT